MVRVVGSGVSPSMSPSSIASQRAWSSDEGGSSIDLLPVSCQPRPQSRHVEIAMVCGGRLP
ncbi:hypothetical protein D3C83_306880 [compost metagenome]